MLQVLQHQKSGVISVVEVPEPQCIDKGILVRNCFSAISPGTEKTSYESTRSSLFERARSQPKQVQTVIDNLKREGIRSTLNKVFSKLDSYKTFGYSSSGIVIESKSEFFSVGDRVACGGAGVATHSEIISVPQNLAVKIPNSVSFEESAFTTIGTIALQGVRQANPKLGEFVAVIGLGIIGLITIQLLKANGCLVAGIDIREDNFELAKSFGCNLLSISREDSIPELLAFTDGMGFDSILITASTESSQPTELALKIARKKARVVVVGSVGMNIPRTPFYEKELEFTISCSYGPGRYDKSYEERGIDYPYPYVRWTENRNMKAFLQLLEEKKINLVPLITHTFDIQDAASAYELLAHPNEKFVGILLKYPLEKKFGDWQVKSSARKIKTGGKRIAFIGAGSFAQFYLLPALKQMDVEFHTVTTSNPSNAVSVAKHFGFKFASTNSFEVINNSEIDFVFIATRHDTHSKFVIASIEANKPVFVEKPLAIKLEELKEIEGKWKANPVPLMVGFNRRFSRAFREIKSFFAHRKQPMAIHYRVNAGAIPQDHWIHNPDIGGGRIIGEVCHFVDTMIYLTGVSPYSVFAESISHTLEQTTEQDTIVVTLKFTDGSIGTIEYFANGDSSIGKEYCEVFCENKIAILDDFEALTKVQNKKVSKIRLNGSKGHLEEMKATLEMFREGDSPIPFNEIFSSTITTFAIIKSLQEGRKIFINEVDSVE